jgi:hypothetical protein
LKEKLLESKESRRHHSSVATALNYPGQVERSGLLSVSTTDDELAEGTSTTRSRRSVWFLAMCRGMAGARPIGDGLRQTGTVPATHLIWHGALQRALRGCRAKTTLLTHLLGLLLRFFCRLALCPRLPELPGLVTVAVVSPPKSRHLTPRVRPRYCPLGLWRAHAMKISTRKTNAR